MELNGISIPFLEKKEDEGAVVRSAWAGPHSHEILCILYGSLLGDGCYGERRSNGNTRFILRPESSNVAYLMWYHRLLADAGYVSPKRPKLLSRVGSKHHVRFYYFLRTWDFSSLNWLYDEFYPKGVFCNKVVPKSLEDFFSPMTVAIWVHQNAGVIDGKVKINLSRLFTWDEIHFLVNLLQFKYGLEVTPRDAYRRFELHIHKASHPQLIALISKEIHPSMFPYPGAFYEQLSSTGKGL